MYGQKNNNLISRGKRLAFLLRHDKNYLFDEHGWREISDLITNYGYTMDELKEIVETNNKQRYEFSEDMTRIRARQGHSVHVDVELEEKLPPDVLYHGTGEQSLASILEQGINKGNRLYVHLSETSETAVNVGKRHGKPVVLVIDAKRMAEDGHKFFLSRNGVWLTDYVDLKYLNGVLNMEDYFATERNGHQLIDFYDPGTNTLDIRSNGVYPSNVLSNLCSNGFRFDGMVCGSMEGFLQSLKHQDKDKQRQICSMKGGNARKRSVTSWQTDQIVWWKGQAYDRQGKDYQALIRRAYQAMFEQSERFRAALMQTRGITLIHSSGEMNPYKTILTPQEFCLILTEMRDNYDKRDKQIEKERRVLVETGDLSFEIIVHKNDVSDFEGERIALSYDLFTDMNSVFSYLSVPTDRVTELGFESGLVLSIPHKLLDGHLLIVETDAEYHYHSLEELKTLMERDGCGLKVLEIKEIEENKIEIKMEPIPGASQKVVFIDENPRLSPAGCYVLATDFDGEFFIGLMLEDKEGKRTPLWGEDYSWK